MIAILFSLLILLVVFAVVWRILTMIPIPPNFGWLVRVIFGVFFLICVLQLLFGGPYPFVVHYWGH